MTDITVTPTDPIVGELVTFTAPDTGAATYDWTLKKGNKSFALVPPADGSSVDWDTEDLEPGQYTVSVTMTSAGKGGGPGLAAPASVTKSQRVRLSAVPVGQGDVVPVSMRRAHSPVTPDLPLWTVIRKSSEALSFERYSRFLDFLLCGLGEIEDAPTGRKTFKNLRQRRALPYTDSDAYRLLKVGTEAFLMVSCGIPFGSPGFDGDDLADLLHRVQLDTGVDLDELWHSYLVKVNGTDDLTIPYLALVKANLRDIPLKNAMFAVQDPHGLPEECFGILREKLTRPCLLELIWSYWHEEGMLSETMRAISTRFQNVRAPGDSDPLAMVEIDPLRPLNNLLWSHVQDEQHRLSAPRRAYEYAHHYGLTLNATAMPGLRPADNRSRFIEAFHNLLHLCGIFFKEDDDTTIVADGFPVLNALKDVHLLLSEGAHNQFGDLPSTSRIEMLMEQWLLARPEFTQFLPTRVMVAYPEPWMNRVDAMKSVQRWTDSSVLHFSNLGIFGERILLSVRYGAWSTANDPARAANWSRFWRQELQGYMHAYRTVTGVDITERPDATLPAVLLRGRLPQQRRPEPQGTPRALPRSRPAPAQGQLSAERRSWAEPRQ